MEQRISLVTLGVADLARARAFCEALGWSGAKQPDDEVRFFQARGMVFGLWTALGGHGAPGVELAGQRALTRGRRPRARRGRARRRHHHPPGGAGDWAEQRARSPTPMATCGKWPITLTGPSTVTAQYTSELRSRHQATVDQCPGKAAASSSRGSASSRCWPGRQEWLLVLLGSSIALTACAFPVRPYHSYLADLRVRAPQKSLQSRVPAASPTRNPRTKRHSPARGSTTVKNDHVSL